MKNRFKKINKKTLRMGIYAVFLASFALIFADINADISSLNTGKIDWLKGKIISFGDSEVTVDRQGQPLDGDNGSRISLNKGRLEAYTTAKEEAILNLVSTLKTMQVDPDNKIVDLLKKHSITRKKLSKVIEQRIKTREYPASFFKSRCKAELKIGDIISVLPYTYPSHDFPTMLNSALPTDYTSLVIDARGLDIKPMIFPALYNEEGLEIYSRYFVDIRYAGRYGMASFAFTEDEAMKNKKAGEHPYFSVAIKNINHCPVLSNRDIRRIFSSSKTIKNLKKCKVIIIIDRK
ncbi:MAG: hypothetical protein GY754_06825 [bacterium]|nr:hypothetical protein [bacterium]